MKKPNIFEYLDIISYLSDYYMYRKSIHSGFSYESWAAELELKSRSFLRMMVLGKKNNRGTCRSSYSAKFRN